MWVDMSYMDGKGLLPTGLLYLSWSSLSCLLGIHRAFCFDLAALGSHWSRYIHAAPCSYIQMCLLENMFTWFGSSSTCNIENQISRALSITSSLPLSSERYLRAFLGSWWRNMNLLSKWEKQLPLVPAILWFQQVWSPSTSTWCKGDTFHMLSSWLRCTCPWLRSFLWFYVQLSHQSIPPCQRPRRIGNNLPSLWYL